MSAAGTIAVMLAGILIAVANGANDVSKGIATLVGSGVTDYRRAMRWGTIWTALGALAGGSLAWAMIATFGHGLLAPGTTPSFTATLATILGAAAWVLIATRTGLPVSTTHAIVGAIAGVGALAYGPFGIDWAAIGGKVVLPLLLSPAVSLALTMVLVRLPPVRSGAAREPADCVCLDVEPALAPVAAPAGVAFFLERPHAQLTIAPRAVCAAERPRVLRFTVDHAHWITSGATSFARGMNDAPKMVALMLAASALSPAGSPVTPQLMLVSVMLGMVAGSLLGGRRVTSVLAEHVTQMDHRTGFVANLVTACLVGAGAVGGLPMSTTHVSSGAIIAAGETGSTTNWGTVGDMAVAWVVTMPAAAILGGIAFALVEAGWM